MTTPQPDLARDLEALPDLARRLRQELARAVFGPDDVVRLLLTGVLARGHSLVTGVPGLAKTLLVQSLADVLDLEFKRVQFTPDLMPSDITGSEVLEEDRATGRRAFRMLKGPVFTHLLLADEINRATPRTQSALLQAMQEQAVTVAGTTHRLEEPFVVVATQNPIEHEGTYPLPEAQLDRFLFSIAIGYPAPDDELAVVRAYSAGYRARLERVLTRAELVRMQAATEGVGAGDSVLRAALELVRRTRPGEADAAPLAKAYVAYGAGPRAGVFLLRAARAWAGMEGRQNVSVEDLCALAPAVLGHRVLLNYRGVAEGIAPADVIREALAPLTGAA